MTLKWLRFLVFSMSVAFAASCGDDDGGDDGTPMPDAAATADAPAAEADAAAGMPDAAAQTLCDMYCTCMMTNCPGSFSDTPTCLTACNGLAPADQQCRNQHCGFAAGGGAATHCPHARGEAVCN